jgi:hypothetical protein
MVAVIYASSSLSRALNYNEQKVKTGQASCLAAVNYPKDTDDLSFHQKLKRLTNLAALNERTKLNSIHISLNFDTSEKLDNDTLEKIAVAYMDKVGFGNQPYLLYQHFDAGHPHLHIVTTNIKADGKRIELHNLGKNQSEKARKEIEISFKLIKAQNKKPQYEIKPVDALKIRYGKSETKRSITNVLDAVLNTYKYSSLHELNAVLKLYNVAADRGSEDSRTFKNNGLLYRILDDKGNKIGVPVKASLIYNKPTLKYLLVKFELNQTAKQFHKQRIKNIIDLAFIKTNNASLPDIIKTLQKDFVHVELRQNKEGLIYGVTYIDHVTKCVFNGSDLGKSYSAKGLQEKCNNSKSEELLNRQQKEFICNTTKLNKNNNGVTKALEIIIDPEMTNNFIPFPLRRSKKKKKKRLSI